MRLRHPHGVARSPARTTAVAAAMVGLLAIASLATRRGGGSTAPPGSGAAAVIGHHLAVVGALVLGPIALVVGAALFMYAQIYKRDADPELRKKLADARRRTVVLLAIVAGLVVYYVRTGHNPIAFLHLRNPFGHPGGSGHTSAPKAHLHGGTSGAITTTDWTLAALLWAAVLAATALLVWRARASRRSFSGPLPAAVVEEAAGPDLDGLRRERDPRRAVIAAYAVMERLMARDGLPRRVHEAPMEYLGRVTIHGHDRVAPVHRLTGLFQRARFSRRPIDEDMRRRAIAAVEELAADRDDPL